jgi:hypothetical protein
LADPTSDEHPGLEAPEPLSESPPIPAPAPAPEPAAPPDPESETNLARRRFFRQFAGDLIQTAATVAGAA